MSEYIPPPKGWRVFNGQLILDPTLWGYMHRKQVVRGSCYTRECRRNYYLDLEVLLRRGYAYVQMKEIQRLLLCHMPGGCSMTFRYEKEGSGLPLSVLAATAMSACCSAAAAANGRNWSRRARPSPS